jgi:nucleotide-binding universal stress UspA family protein
MKNILVCIDFEDDPEILLNKAIEFGIAFEANVSLVHVAAPDPDFVGYEAGPQYIRDARADELKEEHKLLHKYANKLIDKGISTKAFLIQGSTIETIIEKARKTNSDLIILGQHRKSFIYKTLYGSVSEEVMRKTKIPVLIIPI